MNKQFELLREDFVSRVESLENAKSILKKEFFGIDKIIDELIEHVRSWYTMYDFQERPLVLNLWGLTGVGKTSVVVRLMELLDFDDKTFQIDLGEKSGSKSLKNVINDIGEFSVQTPIVIILDEFQHARSLKGHFREEIEEDKTRVVWELIDSGRVNYYDWFGGLFSFEAQIKKLELLLKRGVVVKKGKVVQGQEIFARETYVEHNENDELLFFDKEDYERILEYAGVKFGLELCEDVEKKMLDMDGAQTIDFLYRVLRHARRPKSRNFTKALIVILGNIDEAYTMSSNYSADISADEFHEQSLKITLPTMKKALRRRFRDEQIARLGNRHIIYPALNQEAYYGIIDKQIEQLDKKLYADYGLNFSIDSSVRDILYKEGVFPTQGARPLITTVQSVINSRVSIYLNQILTKQLSVDSLKLSFEAGSDLICKFFKNQELVYTHTDKLSLSMENLRKPKQDENQSITAVHESGHVVLSAILLQNIPEVVYSVTSDDDSSGFVYSKPKNSFFSKSEMIPYVAMLLGGLLAEELIFGSEYKTSGGQSDLLRASEFIISMLKTNGFGDDLIYYSESPTKHEYSYHRIDEIEEMALKFVRDAKTLALETLQKERALLLELAMLLSKQAKLEKSELEQIVKKFAVSPLKFHETPNYYREKLKQEYENLGTSSAIKVNYPMIMNKEHGEI